MMVEGGGKASGGGSEGGEGGEKLQLKATVAKVAVRGCGWCVCWLLFSGLLFLPTKVVVALSLIPNFFLGFREKRGRRS